MRNMSGFGKAAAFLTGLAFIAANVPDGAARAQEAVPVSGAFVTLERASGGTLKYSSTRPDGTFLIKSLAKGKYRMSITPPRRDRAEDFDLGIEGAFKGIWVQPAGNVSKSDTQRSSRSRKIRGSTILIPASLWRKEAIWLDVDVTREDVSGRFDYVLNDVSEVSVLLLSPVK